MFRLPDHLEALEATRIAQSAVNRGLTLEVSYLKFLSVHPKGRFPGARTVFPPYARKAKGHVWFDDSLSDVYGVREMFESTPTHKTVEPVLVDWTTHPHSVPWSRMWERAPYMDVIWPGRNGPRPRTIRLDRVIVRNGRLSLRVKGPTRYRGTGLDPTVKRV